MAQEVPADALGDEFKGYVVRITGGNDVRSPPLPLAPSAALHPGRVRLLTASCPLLLPSLLSRPSLPAPRPPSADFFPHRSTPRSLARRLACPPRLASVNTRRSSRCTHDIRHPTTLSYRARPSPLRSLRDLVDLRESTISPHSESDCDCVGDVRRVQKQGFPLKQGVLVPHRVRLLLAKGHSCYRPRRDGERKRKSVRGCIVGPDVRALHLVVVKQGEADIPGLTDTVLPKRLGPKRATKIRRFFNLDKSDDVRKFVIRREVVPKKEGAKPYTKAPKVRSPQASVLEPSSPVPLLTPFASFLFFLFSYTSEDPEACYAGAPAAPPSPALAQAPHDRAPEGPEG